jgi:hypothetical protein
MKTLFRHEVTRVVPRAQQDVEQRQVRTASGAQAERVGSRRRNTGGASPACGGI